MYGEAPPRPYAKCIPTWADEDKSIRWLQKAVEQHSYLLFVAREIPDFDSLRADPRLEDMLTQAGFPKN